MDYQNLTIQTYYDPYDKKKKINKIFKYNQRLVNEYQKQLCAITWCINPQENLNKRGVDNTKQFLRIGLDCDVAKEGEQLSKREIINRKKLLLSKIKYLPLFPAYLIESKNGYQPIWEFSDPVNLEAGKRNEFNEHYKIAVKQLCEATGLTSEGDSISRVLRLPGTYHYKNPNDPFKTKLVYEGKPANRVKFSQIYKINPEKEYSINGNITVNKNNFEQIAIDYGWLTSTLINLEESAPWMWRGTSNTGRNELMKSVCASVLFTFVKKGWTLEDGEEMCWFLNSKLAKPISSKEFKNLLYHKINRARRLTLPKTDNHGWINREIEQLIPDQQSKPRVILPDKQIQLKIDKKNQPNILSIPKIEFKQPAYIPVQCNYCSNWFAPGEHIISHHKWCAPKGGGRYEKANFESN